MKMNVTIKQLISLLLMTATMALFLSFLPEHPPGSVQNQTTTHLASQVSK